MNLTRITGSADGIRGLAAVSGLHADVESARRVGDDWEITAYGSDAALDEVRARGLAVRVIMDNEQLAAHRATVRSQISDVPGAAAPPTPGARREP